MRQIAPALVRKFFVTIGAVLPVVDEVEIMAEIDKFDSQACPCEVYTRPLRALLSIVFAYALYTTDNKFAESYYYQALALLNSTRFSISSIESGMAALYHHGKM